MYFDLLLLIYFIFIFISAGSQPILSSTPLQVLFYLNSWYFAAFYLAEILMFIYKDVPVPTLLLLQGSSSPTRPITWFWTWFCWRCSSVWRRCGSSTAGRGTCVSAPWPPAPRSSSSCPAPRWPSTSCCCRPSSCGWSSSSAPACSASTAWSCCWASSPWRPSPGPKFTEEDTSLTSPETEWTQPCK
ncbi:transmembrane protein 216 isoform X3 [Pseudoliparis swirei]|uniref:transmembrane protein 216 isoform X3 n=1 Tax=Pseudoliparis swirei TaxID=2059687 RepID=UPI0024BE4C5C|nr:transmembrane protein 216 isoform X3 [Pseudoliparis swirei]